MFTNCSCQQKLFSSKLKYKVHCQIGLDDGLPIYTDETFSQCRVRRHFLQALQRLAIQSKSRHWRRLHTPRPQKNYDEKLDEKLVPEFFKKARPPTPLPYPSKHRRTRGQRNRTPGRRDTRDTRERWKQRSWNREKTKPSTTSRAVVGIPHQDHHEVPRRRIQNTR